MIPEVFRGVVTVHKQPYRDANGAWIWVTRDGREIAYLEMDLNHLQNTVNMIRRENPVIDSYIELFAELKRRAAPKVL